MKTITLSLSLLVAVLAQVTNAQPILHSSALAGSGNISSIQATPQTTLHDATAPADLSNPAQPESKLAVIASPNPFTNRTVLTCSLPAKGKLTIAIRNMLGETVKSTEETIDQEGDHSVEVTSDHLRPGIYTAMLVFKTSDKILMKSVRIVCSL